MVVVEGIDLAQEVVHVGGVFHHGHPVQELTELALVEEAALAVIYLSKERRKLAQELFVLFQLEVENEFLEILVQQLAPVLPLEGGELFSGHFFERALALLAWRD